MPSRLRKRLPWGTLRLRLAAWNTAVVLTMTVTAVLIARWATRETLYRAVDEELRGGVREVVMAVEDLFPNMDAIVAAARRKAASHAQRGWFTMLLTEEGALVWKSELCPDEVARLPPFNLDRTENIVQVGPYRYVRRRIISRDAPQLHIRVGAYTTGLEASLAGLTRVLLAVAGIVCAITPLAGWWLAARATRPVSDLLETADRLDPTRLRDRLPVRGAGDELDHLAQTINGLLDDVAAHVARQQQFVADAAHELRGPLAAVQSGIELALSRDRDAAEYREALEMVLDEARYLSKIANGLLLLAESGADTVPLLATPVNLGTLARQALAMFGGVAEERGVNLAASLPAEPVMVTGDASQFRQVLGNLLDNAIRFTPAGGTVEVAVVGEPAAGAVTLTVVDSGTGIAAEHLPRLFDRFYKIDASRTRDGDSRSGGLGLPICKAITERHGGTISVVSRPGQGTTVTVRLPLPSQALQPSRLARPTPVGAAVARQSAKTAFLTKSMLRS